MIFPCAVLTTDEKAEAEKNNYNFDHPDAFDIQLLVETLTKLKAGKRVEIPIYNFKVYASISPISAFRWIFRRIRPSSSPSGVDGIDE